MPYECRRFRFFGGGIVAFFVLRAAEFRQQAGVGCYATLRVDRVLKQRDGTIILAEFDVDRPHHFAESRGQLRLAGQLRIEALRTGIEHVDCAEFHAARRTLRIGHAKNVDYEVGNHFGAARLG